MSERKFTTIETVKVKYGIFFKGLFRVEDFSEDDYSESETPLQIYNEKKKSLLWRLINIDTIKRMKELDKLWDDACNGAENEFTDSDGYYASFRFFHLPFKFKKVFEKRIHIFNDHPKFDVITSTCDDEKNIYITKFFLNDKSVIKTTKENDRFFFGYRVERIVK